MIRETEHVGGLRDDIEETLGAFQPRNPLSERIIKQTRAPCLCEIGQAVRCRSNEICSASCRSSNTSMDITTMRQAGQGASSQWSSRNDSPWVSKSQAGLFFLIFLSLPSAPFASSIQP